MLDWGCISPVADVRRREKHKAREAGTVKSQTLQECSCRLRHGEAEKKQEALAPATSGCYSSLGTPQQWPQNHQGLWLDRLNSPVLILYPKYLEG